MHLSDIRIDFFLNFAYISNIGVRFLLFGEVKRSIIPLILGLD